MPASATDEREVPTGLPFPPPPPADVHPEVQQALDGLDALDVCLRGLRRRFDTADADDLAQLLDVDDDGAGDADDVVEQVLASDRDLRFADWEYELLLQRMRALDDRHGDLLKAADWELFDLISRGAALSAE